MPERKVLIIEDDGDIAVIVRLHLEDLGLRVEVEGNGRVGLARALGGGFDLVVLDLMLPGLDGLEICRQLRARPEWVPILMLTSRSTEVDRVLGLELGADDYLTKPFSVRELQARVKALLRRVDALTAPEPDRPSGPVVAGDLTVDPESRGVTAGGRPVELTAKEFDLLLHFARHPGRVATRAQLLDQVWGYAHGGYEHTVNTHINRLRAKVEPDPARPTYIRTVWGVGYRFATSGELARAASC